MGQWNEILAEYAPRVWQTLCRIVPADRAEALFTGAMLDAHAIAQRDSVSNWSSFLQRCGTARAIASMHQAPLTLGAAPTLADKLRAGLVQVSEQQATVFCLRYLSGLSFSEVAMETRVSVDAIGPTANEVCTVIGRRLLAAHTDETGQISLADDLVEAAVAEIRSSPLPALPDELLARTREALASAPEVDFEKPPVPTNTVPLSIASAVIVVLAFSIWGYFTYREKPPAMSFANMLQAVSHESSVRYQITRNLQLPDGRMRKVEAELTVLEPGHIRQVMEPPGSIVIWDTQQQKALTLDGMKQRATLRDSADMFEETRPIDVLGLLKGLKPDDAAFSGQTTLQGRPAQGFKVDRPEGRMSIWADVESKLPIMVELALPQAPLPGDALMHEFVWGPPLDAAQFALVPPQGYELAAIKVNLKPATEQDLVKALSVAAHLNGGKFPDQFDRAGMSQLTAQLYKKLPAKEEQGYRAAVEELEANLLQIGRGWMFIAEAENGADWRYAGKDVLYGSGRPVLWYRPAGLRTYRIIDSSLDVRPITAERLPDVPSTQLARPAKSPQSLPQKE